MTNKDVLEFDGVNIDDITTSAEQDNSAVFAEKVVEKAVEIVKPVVQAPAVISAPATVRPTSGQGSGIVEIKLGAKVNRVPFEKYKGSTAKKDRVSVITTDIMAVKLHYSEDTGTFICFGGECCEKEGLPMVRYLIPVAVYDTDRNGKPTSSEIQCKVMSAGNELYDVIATMHDASDITQQDIVVICSDEKFQKLQLAPAGNALWRKSAAATNFVNDYYKKNHQFIPLSVGKQLDKISYLRLKGLTADASTTSPEANVSFDDVFK